MDTTGKGLNLCYIGRQFHPGKNIFCKFNIFYSLNSMAIFFWWFKNYLNNPQKLTHVKAYWISYPCHFMICQSLSQSLWEPHSKRPVKRRECFLFDAVTFNGLTIYLYTFETPPWISIAFLEADQQSLIHLNFDKSIHKWVKNIFYPDLVKHVVC